MGGGPSAAGHFDDLKYLIFDLGPKLADLHLFVSV
jgi:hypothetical protein